MMTEEQAENVAYHSVTYGVGQEAENAGRVQWYQGQLRIEPGKVTVVRVGPAGGTVAMGGALGGLIGAGIAHGVSATKPNVLEVRPGPRQGYYDEPLRLISLQMPGQGWLGMCLTSEGLRRIPAETFQQVVLAVAQALAVEMVPRKLRRLPKGRRTVVKVLLVFMGVLVAFLGVILILVAIGVLD